jgi:hypothetical protein
LENIEVPQLCDFGDNVLDYMTRGGHVNDDDSDDDDVVDVNLDVGDDDDDDNDDDCTVSSSSSEEGAAVEEVTYMVVHCQIRSLHSFYPELS